MESTVLPAAAISLFKALIENNVRFIVVGMSGAVLHGAHVVTEDIDLWIENLGDDSFLAAVKDAGGFYIPPSPIGQNPPMLGPEALRIVDLVTTCQGLNTFSEEWENSITMELDGLNVKVLPLDRIILSKQTANREKDRAMLPVLQNTLALLRTNSLFPKK